MATSNPDRNQIKKNSISSLCVKTHQKLKLDVHKKKTKIIQSLVSILAFNLA